MRNRQRSCSTPAAQFAGKADSKREYNCQPLGGRTHVYAASILESLTR